MIDTFFNFVLSHLVVDEEHIEVVFNFLMGKG